MDIKNNKIESIFFAFYILVVLNLRPALLGHVYSSILLLLGVFSIIILYLVKEELILQSRFHVLIISYLLFVSYLFVQTIFLSSYSVNIAISNILFISLGIIPVIFFNKRNWVLTLKVILNITLLFSLSYIITYAIYAITLFSIDLSYIEFKIPEIHQYLSFSIDYPFSVFYRSGTNIFEMIVPRAIGIYREPGIFQVIVIISFFIVDLLKVKYKFIKKSLLIMTLLFTASTAGYIIFIISCIYYFIVTRKHKKNKIIKYFVLLTISTCIVYILISLDIKFGIKSKLSSTSGQVRLDASLNSFSLLSKHPIFGIGAYTSFLETDQLGINFIGTMARLGLLGSLLVLIPYIYIGLKLLMKKSKYLVLVIAPFMTLLFSQPLYDKAFSFLFLAIANYALYFKSK